MTLFALSRLDLADYVDALFLVFIILIFVSILISWIPRIPYDPRLRAVLDFVTETTNPYLNFFRRFLPPLGGGGFAIDLSPIVGLIVLFVARALIVGAIEGGAPTPAPRGAPGSAPAPSALSFSPSTRRSRRWSRPSSSRASR
jgi:YggT family protein